MIISTKAQCPSLLTNERKRHVLQKPGCVRALAALLMTQLLGGTPGENLTKQPITTDTAHI